MVAFLHSARVLLSTLVLLTYGPATLADPVPPTIPMSGKLAATTYCTQCHLMPDPSAHDQRTWRQEVMPRMRVLTGLDQPTLAAGFFDPDLLISSHAFPAKPLIPEAAFNAAGEYFASLAPDKLESIQRQELIRVGLKGFKTQILSNRHAPPLTTLVQIDPIEHRLFLGDATFQGITVFNAAGEEESSFPLGNIPVSLQRRDAGFWFACIGHFFPREQPRGQVLFMKPTPEGLTRTVIAEGLPRLSDIQIADLNGDGRPDFVLCVFGNYVGRCGWWEQKPDGTYFEHVLMDKPGALRSAVRDIDGDGHPDIAVLIAQATESMFVFSGDGKGGFSPHLLWQKPPSWGHSGFDLADFDGDGKTDILVTNGDNADFSTSPPKRSHGVRIMLNRGQWKFEEAWFGPMNGAYRAVARDFDLDGDLDIAAVSFFPDYDASPRESFILFENVSGPGAKQGRFRFEPSTFPECIVGRWLTLDVGDLDGDGDDDIALGSLIRMPVKVPDFLKDNWEKTGPSAVILRNMAKP